MMANTYDGREIANFILDFCDGRGRSITNLALQKVIYFCHVWSLIELDRPLIRHKFEAWEFGPVLPYLYRDFKNYDRSPIEGRASEIRNSSDGKRRIVPYILDPETTDRLEKIVEFYSRLRANDLVELSHVTGGPWHQVWFHKGVVNPGMKIDDKSITDFYSKAPFPFSIQ